MAEAEKAIIDKVTAATKEAYSQLQEADRNAILDAARSGLGSAASPAAAQAKLLTLFPFLFWAMVLLIPIVAAGLAYSDRFSQAIVTPPVGGVPCSRLLILRVC